MMVSNRSGVGVRLSRIIFLLLAVVMVACVIVQTTLAGMAVFGDGEKWLWHASFVHIFEFIPILMIIFAFTGRLPIPLRWLSASLFALIFIQYFTAHFPGAGAIHPVFALLLFWLSLKVVIRGFLHYKQAK